MVNTKVCLTIKGIPNHMDPRVRQRLIKAARGFMAWFGIKELTYCGGHLIPACRKGGVKFQVHPGSNDTCFKVDVVIGGNHRATTFATSPNRYEEIVMTYGVGYFNPYIDKEHKRKEPRLEKKKPVVIQPTVAAKTAKPRKTLIELLAEDKPLDCKKGYPESRNLGLAKLFKILNLFKDKGGKAPAQVKHLVDGVLFGQSTIVPAESGYVNLIKGLVLSGHLEIKEGDSRRSLTQKGKNVIAQ